MGFEHTCTRCGGSGGGIVNIGTTQEPEYDYRKCNRCDGLGYTRSYGDDPDFQIADYLEKQSDLEDKRTKAINAAINAVYESFELQREKKDG